MTPQDPNTDPILDPLLEQAIAEIRNEAIDPAVMEAAGRRVAARLEQHTALRGCADFQTLIPEYRAGTLSAARALLIEDHIHECVTCRKALEAASGKVTAMPVRHARRAWSAMPGFRWAVAAVLVLTAGLVFFALGDRFRPAANGPEAVVESADGRSTAFPIPAAFRCCAARNCPPAPPYERPGIRVRRCACAMARWSRCASAPAFPSPSMARI
jgi:hypothetical protein